MRAIPTKTIGVSLKYPECDLDQEYLGRAFLKLSPTKYCINELYFLHITRPSFILDSSNLPRARIRVL